MNINFSPGIFTGGQGFKERVSVVCAPLASSLVALPDIVSLAAYFRTIDSFNGRMLWIHRVGARWLHDAQVGRAPVRHSRELPYGLVRDGASRRHSAKCCYSLWCRGSLKISRLSIREFSLTQILRLILLL